VHNSLKRIGLHLSKRLSLPATREFTNYLLEIYWPIKKGLIFLSSISMVTIWCNYHNVVRNKLSIHEMTAAARSPSVQVHADLFFPRFLGTSGDLSITSRHFVQSTKSYNTWTISTFHRDGVQSILCFNGRQSYIVLLDTQIFILKLFPIPKSLDISIGLGWYLLETNRQKQEDRDRPRCWGLPFQLNIQ
jgi:hypothetical protein